MSETLHLPAHPPVPRSPVRTLQTHSFSSNLSFMWNFRPNSQSHFCGLRSIALEEL